MSLMCGSIREPILIEEESTQVPAIEDEMAPAKANKEKEKKPKKEKAPPKEKKPKEPKPPKEAKTKEAGKVARVNAARGLPTKAARLVSSNYATFGWHKPLSDGARKIAKDIGSEVNAMYLLQMKRDDAVGALSMRNAVFYEHKQLADQNLVSTPAIDHVDLFAEDEEKMKEVMDIIRIKRPATGENELHMHYFFEGMREREFLLWPILINNVWITFFARLEACGPLYREVTDFTLVDPWAEGREERRKFVLDRLAIVLREAKIRMNLDVARPFHVAGVESRWQTGYVAWEVSREFMRRLSKLLWHRDQDPDETGDDFLWNDLQTLYNYDSYRESLMMACALQCIRKSNYTCRVGIEAPSEDCNYWPDRLRPLKEDVPDEKWHTWEADAVHRVTLEGSSTPSRDSVPATPVESRPVSPAPSQDGKQLNVTEWDEVRNTVRNDDHVPSRTEYTRMEVDYPGTQAAQDTETEPDSPGEVIDEEVDELIGEAIDEPTRETQAAPVPDMGGPALEVDFQITTPSFNDSADSAQIPGLHHLRRSVSPSPPSHEPSEIQTEERPANLLAVPRSPLVGVTPRYGLSPYVTSGEQSEVEDDAAEAEGRSTITPAQAIAQSAMEHLWRKELGGEKREREEYSDENAGPSPKRARVEEDEGED
ncbi:hypothetical protein F5Y18DRAFT_441900 [Xylariaceae sp. FL1019]|nr:hypothetical protein F5Y18DRAFT_441900 [Xylariaceae sp. FL1019]